MQMTREEWLATKSPWTMLEWIHGKATGRQLTLFAYACFARVKRFIPPRRRTHLGIIEQWANGTGSRQVLEKAIENILSGWEPRNERRTVIRELIADALFAFLDYPNDRFMLAKIVAMRARNIVQMSGGSADAECQTHADLLRSLITYPKR